MLEELEGKECFSREDDLNADVDELGPFPGSEDFPRGRAHFRLIVPTAEHAWDSSGRQDGCGHPMMVGRTL